jgi:hypothetical protein
MTRPYNVINVNGHIVPATFHDALKKILHDVSTGRIHADAHRSYTVSRPTSRGMGACMCAIGTFFTNEQLDQIKLERHNQKNARDIASKFGRANFEAMTAMTPGIAGVIQSDFDYLTYHGSNSGIHHFANRVRSMLDKVSNAPNPAAQHTGKWHFPVSMPA